MMVCWGGLRLADLEKTSGGRARLRDRRLRWYPIFDVEEEGIRRNLLGTLRLVETWWFLD